MLNRDYKVYIAGHNGLVGSALLRVFKKAGFHNFICLRSHELDLRIQSDVDKFFRREKPDVVLLAAARVGGILNNINEPAEFIYDNLAIQCNVIHSAYQNNVKKLLFLGSSCVYPRATPQPIKEDYLLSGRFEPTNEAFAVAKIAGLKMCEMYNRQYDTNYINVMPCNLYGIGDNFSINNSHVISATIRKVHEAKINNKKHVVVWGTGKPRREIMYADDLADAALFLLDNDLGYEYVNVGTCNDISIEDLTRLVMKVVGYDGEITYDNSKPDGIPQKLMDCSRLSDAGWHCKTPLYEGIKKTYEWFLDNYNDFDLKHMEI